MENREQFTSIYSISFGVKVILLNRAGSSSLSNTTPAESGLPAPDIFTCRDGKWPVRAKGPCCCAFARYFLKSVTGLGSSWLGAWGWGWGSWGSTAPAKLSYLLVTWWIGDTPCSFSEEVDKRFMDVWRTDDKCYPHFLNKPMMTMKKSWRIEEDTQGMRCDVFINSSLEDGAIMLSDLVKQIFNPGNLWFFVWFGRSGISRLHVLDAIETCRRADQSAPGNKTPPPDFLPHDIPHHRDSGRGLSHGPAVVALVYS